MRTLSLALATLLLLCGAAAHAQKDGDKLREKVRDRIRAFRAERLIALLELDDKSAAKLFPILNKYDDQMMPLHADSGAARRELRQLLAGGGKVDDAKVNKIIDRLLDARAKLAQLDQARMKEARKALTAVQAAKLVVVLPQVEREIERKIRKALRGKGGKGARALDDDDEDE